MFKTNVPVTGKAFFNRKRELEALARIVERTASGNPAWLAILGVRKIGKTSVLLESARMAKGVVFVTLDSFEMRPLSLEVFRLLACRVLDGFFSRQIGWSFESLVGDRDRFEQAFMTSEPLLSLPEELRVLCHSLGHAKMQWSLVAQLLDLPEKLAALTERNVVIAWDEFQELVHIRGKQDIFGLMRARWQKQQRVAYVICGSARTMISDLVLSHSSPFYQHFDLIEMGPFDERSSRELLASCLAQDLGQDVFAWICSITRGHPFYLQVIGEQLSRNEAPYDAEMFKQAVQDVLFSRNGRLSLYFDSKFGSAVGRSSNLAACLSAMADGPRTLSEIAKQIGAATGATANYLERLRDDVVKLDDGSYAIVDHTFGLWLRWRRPGGSVVPMTLLGDEAEISTARELARMGFDLVYQSRASRGAFDLLATWGAAQLGLQVKRQPMPLRFTKSEWNRMIDEAKRLGWDWVIASVDPQDSSVRFHDPQRARKARSVTLDADSAIENLLQWLDQT